MIEEFGGGGDILFERRGRAGVVTLTRGGALNAVTHAMVLSLQRALDAWKADDSVALVVIKAEGRAFSAGGDIVDIYKAGKAGRPPVAFFADEYRLNAAIRCYPKPYVALIDGIAMGGGVGISYHGSHRVVTENAVFAMPECGIGFFPDVGGSFILPRLKGAYGMYIGLTGVRVGSGDQCWSGLATHMMESSALPSLFDELCEADDIGKLLKARSRPRERETHEARIHAINKHFSLGSLADVVRSLQADEAADSFARETLGLLREKSPTSMLVAFDQIAAGAALDIDECMRMEFRILNRMLAGTDFYEGIRAAVIHKDRRPAWSPPTLGEVSETDVSAYFAPLPDGELDL